jgi:hypothetical protein
MDTIIYRRSGNQQNIAKEYLFYNITKDTTNQYDVFDDTSLGLYFILISPNKFLIMDKDVAINVSTANDYIIRETPTTAANPFGLTFTLKTNTTTVRNLSDVLFAFAYDRGSVTNLSQLFMFIAEINAEAVFTTPLFLSAQPHIFCRYGPYKNAAGVITQPSDRFINSGYALKGLMPWSEIVSKRGDITAYITDPIPAADALKVGLITVKSPGVYLINGMIQFAAVTAPIQGMEIGLRINKNPTDVQHTCKVGPLQDGGVPFTFCIFISEFDINASDSTIAKAQGEAYLQINVGYEKGSSSLNSLKLVKDDGRFC